MIVSFSQVPEPPLQAVPELQLVSEEEEDPHQGAVV